LWNRTARVLAPVALAAALPTATPQQPAAGQTPLELRTYTLALGAPGWRLDAADFDGNGRGDVVLVTRPAPGQVERRVYSGTASGVLRLADQQTHLFPSSFLAPALAVADLGQGALPDFGLTRISLGQAFLSDGDLQYSGQSFFPSFGGEQHDLGFTDVDGDGDRDSVLLVRDIGGDFLDFGFNDGAGHFTRGAFVSSPVGIGLEAWLLFADTDNDGRDGTYAVNGAQLRRSPWPDGPDTGETLLTGDGDGFLDLAVAAPGAGGVYLLLNDGAGDFPVASFHPAAAGSRSVAVGDLDGNGSTDLALANRTSGTISILLGDGLGHLGPAQTIAFADPVDIEAVDLDGDGRADLAVLGGTSAQLTVMLSRP
jgi:hypothetical protein